MAKSPRPAAEWDGLERSLRKKSFSPVYLIYGEEDLLIDEAVALLIREAIDDGARSFNLDILSGQDVDPRHLIALASSYPMMSDRRVVVLKDFDKLGGKDLLLPYLQQPMASTVLVLVTERIDLRQKIYKILQDNAKVVVFRQLYDNEIPDWISGRVRSLGKEISPEACQLLNTYLGRSLREIQQEIDKLFLYVGSKQIIDVDDVTAIVGVSRSHNIFELQRAIGRKDLSASLSIMEAMLDSGENALGMIVMLTKYFQKLWMIQGTTSTGQSDFQLSSAIGVSPSYVAEYRSAARHWTGDEIEQCFSALVNADLQLKTSQGEMRVILTTALFRMLNRESGRQPD